LYKLTQGDGCAMILKFLAESVGQPRTTPHLHPRGQVEALHVGRADLLRIASYHVFLDSIDVTWGVAMRRIGQG